MRTEADDTEATFDLRSGPEDALAVRSAVLKMRARRLELRGVCLESAA